MKRLKPQGIIQNRKSNGREAVASSAVRLAAARMAPAPLGTSALLPGLRFMHERTPFCGIGVWWVIRRTPSCTPSDILCNLSFIAVTIPCSSKT